MIVVRDHGGIDIARHRIDGLIHRDLFQIAFESILRWLHQRTMEWCAYGQHFGAFGAAFIGESGGAFDRSGIARDDNLLRRVDVGGGKTVAVGRLVENRRNLFKFHAEYGSHSPYAYGYGFLHVLAAIADGAHSVGKCERSSRDVGGVFAQAMPCYRAWLWYAGFKNSE